MKLVVYLMTYVVLATAWTAAEDLPCIDNSTGQLIGGFVESGLCVDDSVFFYDLRSGPITSNGLHAGAPTHLHLWFGSIGSLVEDAFDPTNYGLYINGDKGRMQVDLSPHFIYDRVANRPAQPLSLVELATQPANILFPSPCSFDYNTERGQIYCSGWVSRLGLRDSNRIEVFAPDGLFGRRALEIGLKFFHLHPPFEGGYRGIYFNANGTCDNDTSNSDQIIYCRHAADCPANFTCVPPEVPFTASVTVTLLDREGNIYHKGTRSYAFDTEPAYVAHSSNTGLASGNELVEAVDFQRVTPGTICQGWNKAEGDPLHSSGVPYAPRFYMFGPNPEANAFPQPKIANLTANLTSTTTGVLYDLDQEIGRFDLMGPEGGDSILLAERLGAIGDGPGRFGGTLVAIPVQAGTVLGKYTVMITMKSGKTAVSNFVVVSELGEASAAFYPTTQFYWAIILVTLFFTLWRD